MFYSAGQESPWKAVLSSQSSLRPNADFQLGGAALHPQIGSTPSLFSQNRALSRREPLQHVSVPRDAYLCLSANEQAGIRGGTSGARGTVYIELLKFFYKEYAPTPSLQATRFAIAIYAIPEIGLVDENFDILNRLHFCCAVSGRPILWTAFRKYMRFIFVLLFRIFVPEKCSELLGNAASYAPFDYRYKKNNPELKQF